MKIKFFKTPADFRKWLQTHHTSVAELWVGYYKKDSGKPSITWPESVDEALCFGWIDGLRKSVDDVSYTIRFTPRRKRSVWSSVNINRANALIKQRLMQPAGLKAFAARKEYRSGIYTYEQRSVELPDPYASELKKNSVAWKYFNEQRASYRKAITWWILSAKKKETRLKRLGQLIEHSSKGRWIPQYVAVTKTKAT
ncbi:MAG: YdeI/OmpD-associated family protein [Acidobacteriota bacterium]|nr:YdeI/OmpD-associated family protein [Acidobacteriota bacterium]